MLFFKRILKEPEPPQPAPAAPVVLPPTNTSPPIERRRSRRYVVNPQFPIKALLSFRGHKGTASPTGEPQPVERWEGRLINCSEHGVRILMNSGQKVGVRDLCDLHLAVQEFQMTIPARISNINVEAEGLVFGLQHDDMDAETRQTYLQLIDILSLGAGLRLGLKTSTPDATGNLMECYSNKQRTARLTVWRVPATGGVASFEFLLKDSLVRGVTGQRLEFRNAADGRAATAGRAGEIRRLFQWVVPNVAETVPIEVRDILKRYCAEEPVKEKPKA
jgi:hypothetical protein